MGNQFERGVKYYTPGVATVHVSFPEDTVCCRYCEFLRADANGARHKCVLTDEILLRLDGVGGMCPVAINAKEDET